VESNERVILRRRPEGPIAEEDFARERSPVRAPAEGELLLENHYLSIDPAIRQWVAGRVRYIAPIEPGGVVRCVVMGRVVESRLPGFAPGDWVRALGGWESYSLVTPADFPTRIPEDLDVPVTWHLGVLGNAGLSAYFGLLRVGGLHQGETVLVSAAAGAVGSAVGQLAAIHGATAIGLTSSLHKMAWLTDELGFEHALNYRDADAGARLKAICPRGVDVYFDNAGGRVLEMALGRLAQGARVVLCGAVSQYDSPAGPMHGPANYLALLEKNASMLGFTVSRFHQEFDEITRKLGDWVREGRLRHREEFLDGLDQAPRALRMLLDGGNCGKLMVRLPAAGRNVQDEHDAKASPR